MIKLVYFIKKNLEKKMERWVVNYEKEKRIV